MLKHAIRLYSEKRDAHLIFIATPNELHRDYEWYVTKEIGTRGEKINEQHYPSYPTSTDIIRKRGYEGHYLYCNYLNIHTNKVCCTKPIHLCGDIDKMIAEGTMFDDISQYDEQGAIVACS